MTVFFLPISVVQGGQDSSFISVGGAGSSFTTGGGGRGGGAVEECRDPNIGPLLITKVLPLSEIKFPSAGIHLSRGWSESGGTGQTGGAPSPRRRLVRRRRRGSPSRGRQAWHLLRRLPRSSDYSKKINNKKIRCLSKFTEKKKNSENILFTQSLYIKHIKNSQRRKKIRKN